MKLKLITILALFALNTSAAFAASCPTEISGSCTYSGAQGSACLDALSGAMTDREFKSHCTSDQHGTYSASPCTTASLVGSCLMNMNAATPVVILRMYQPIPAQYVPMICTQAGGSVCN